MTPIVKIFSALSAASIVMMTSLASKHALRGGIDVGLATQIGPEEIYGTALERAYVLESRHAKYPRVAIGDEFWTYLGAALRNSATVQAQSRKLYVPLSTGLWT